VASLGLAQWSYRGGQILRAHGEDESLQRQKPHAAKLV
jgi:hypothetical protein